MESGRPLGMSTERLRESRWDSRLECLVEVLEELCLLDEDVLEDECLDEDLLDLDAGTSRMFKVRPVVGSVVED
jgi:hypothetical protein